MRKPYTSLPAIVLLLLCAACDKKHCWHCMQTLQMTDTVSKYSRMVETDTLLCDLSEGQKTDYVIDGIYTRHVALHDTVWEMQSVTDCKKR